MNYVKKDHDDQNQNTYTEYCDYDQSVNLVCTLRIQYHIQNVSASRSYPV